MISFSYFIIFLRFSVIYTFFFILVGCQVSQDDAIVGNLLF
jgi:hypothetical protein